MNQKTRNDPYPINQNEQIRSPSISLVTNDEFYGNQHKSQLGEDYSAQKVQQTDQNIKNIQKDSVNKTNELKHKNMKILQELKDISDQLQSALEKQKIQQNNNRVSQANLSQRDQRAIQQYQAELEKAFNILDLQRRDINMLNEKISSQNYHEKKIEELNQKLVDQSKDIQSLEHEKSYLNKVLGNVDKIMKAEGQKDQKLQQVHIAYKDEVRMLKDRIREMENIQRQSEKNAMKLHQHYLDLEDKYKQSLQNQNNSPNKSPNKIKQREYTQSFLLEQIKSDYEDKIQTYIQKLNDKENENKSLQTTLQAKQNEVNDLKVQVKEFQIQIQRELRDKEMIESFNKNLREQLKIQAQRMSQESTPTIQGKEQMKNGVRSRLVTPRRDYNQNNGLSPYKSVNNSQKREINQKSHSNSQERKNYSNNNSINKGNYDGIKIYNKQDSLSNKKTQNQNFDRHNQSVEFQPREDFIQQSEKFYSSAFQEDNSKQSFTPQTPPKKQYVRKQIRSTSVHPEQNKQTRLNQSIDKNSLPSNNNSNIFSAKKRESTNKSGMYASKIIIRDSYDFQNSLQPASARNKRQDNQNIIDHNQKNSSLETPQKNDQNVLIETPYVRTLNSKYLALKNQSDVKSTLQTELSSILERKQNKILNQSPQVSSKNIIEIDNQNNSNLSNQYPSDQSEYDLNYTFTEFQKEVSRKGLPPLVQGYENSPNQKDRNNTVQYSYEDNNENDNQNNDQIKPNQIQIKQQKNNEIIPIQVQIGKIQPENQILFSDKENVIGCKRIVGGRIWVYKQTNKIMGIQMQYLTADNNLIWGTPNVHLFTNNVSIHSFSLSSNSKQNNNQSNDKINQFDFVNLIASRYNDQYNYVESLLFITHLGKTFNFGKISSDQIQSPLHYFDIDALKEAPSCIFGSISKEYDPMSGNLIGTKLSSFGCYLDNIETKSINNQEYSVKVKSPQIKKDIQNNLNKDKIENTELIQNKKNIIIQQNNEEQKNIINKNEDSKIKIINEKQIPIIEHNNNTTLQNNQQQSDVLNNQQKNDAQNITINQSALNQWKQPVDQQTQKNEIIPNTKQQ